MGTFVTGFLELINNMLTSGMVPALFADDEKEGIIGQVRIFCIYHLVSHRMILQVIFLHITQQFISLSYKLSLLTAYPALFVP